MVHLFLLRRAENHFASSELTRHATHRKARLLVNQVSIAVLAVGVAWGGWNISRVFQASEADQKVAVELRALNREYDDITRALPSFGVGGSTMRDAVTFYNGSIRGFPTLIDFVVALSAVLGAHPEVRLNQLAWQATDDPNAIPKMALTPASKNLPPVKALARGGEAAVAQLADPGPNPPFAEGRYEIALIEGTVRVANNDFRGAVEEVERLAADIGKVAGFRANVLESPLDVSPALALQGRHSEREAALMEPRFVLRIVRERRGAA
jgi:hypothetical protein